MDGYAAHAAPGYHPGGNGAVDAAGEQRNGPAVGADGQSARALGGRRVDIGRVVAHLEVDDELRVPDVDARLGIGLGEEAADVLGELDAREVEALVGALGLDLEALRGEHVVAQILDGELGYGVLVLLAGRGARERHDAEGLAQRVEGRVHVRELVLRLHIDRALHAVDVEGAHGLEPLSYVGHELLLEKPPVEPLQDDLALFEQYDVLQTNHLKTKFRAPASSFSARAGRPRGGR